MRKLVITLLLVFCCVPFVKAQDEYHKFEVYAGYSYQDNYTPESDLLLFPETSRHHGFNASATYNFSKHLGLKVDVADHFATGTIYSGIFGLNGTILSNSTNTKKNNLSLQAGIQIKNNSKEARFKPFGHVLAGMTRLTTKLENTNNSPAILLGTDKITTSGFSATLGGGLDIRVSKRIDVRVIQFNYNPVFAKSKSYTYNGSNLTYSGGTFTSGSTFSLDSKRYNLYNIGFGIVFH